VPAAPPSAGASSRLTERDILRLCCCFCCCTRPLNYRLRISNLSV
jgi:hypothetical protein